MADADYIAALVSFGKLNPANIQTLKNDFSALYVKIRAGNGRSVSSVTIPGQTVSWAPGITLDDQFAALGEALRQLSGTGIIRRTSARYS